jgi:hypothetical protein
MGSEGLKVYCAGSMRGGGVGARQLHEAVEVVHSLGHTVLSELSPTGSIPVDVPGSGDTYLYNQDIAWLDSADCMVAIVSSPSLGTGYEISYALHVRTIPVLALYGKETGTLSAMIKGNSSFLLELARFEDRKELVSKIGIFLDKITMDTGTSC